MTARLPPVDIVVVGMGWAGSVMAKELAATGLKIVGLERGDMRTTQKDLVVPMKEDEIRYSRRNELMQDVTRETVTFRNNASQTALPMRKLGAFLPGEGVGGSGLHWGGITYRFHEWDFSLRTRTLERYGRKIVPEDMQLQDWGLSYADLEPYYEKFEIACGTSGKAGNLNGRKSAAGNIFEEARRSEYPNPPMPRSQATMLFDDAARKLGLHPYPAPASMASRSYVTPEGVRYGQCHCCGFCVGYACQADAKASPHFAMVPLAMKHLNFELRTQSRVLKVDLDSSGRKAVGVTYLDSRGREVSQPAELVILTAYALGNVHLMLLSGIGKSYDSQTGQGVVGRNYAYQSFAYGKSFFDEKMIFNTFMGSGGVGSAIGDFAAGNRDFAQTGVIGSGNYLCGSGGAGPIAWHPVPHDTPRWGSEWKKAVVRYYNHSASVAAHGSVMSYRQNYLDLDPTYKDAFGRPLLRVTFDFGPNEVRFLQQQLPLLKSISEAMGAQRVDTFTVPIPFSVATYQSTHNMGGAVLGADPATSAVNTYLQSWDVPNVFVVGGSAFPQNPAHPPTGTIGALAFYAADAIKSRYLRNPGALLHA